VTQQQQQQQQQQQTTATIKGERRRHTASGIEAAGLASSSLHSSPVSAGKQGGQVGSGAARGALAPGDGGSGFRRAVSVSQLDALLARTTSWLPPPPPLGGMERQHGVGGAGGDLSSSGAVTAQCGGGGGGGGGGGITCGSASVTALAPPTSTSTGLSMAERCAGEECGAAGSDAAAPGQLQHPHPHTMYQDHCHPQRRVSSAQLSAALPSQRHPASPDASYPHPRSSSSSSRRTSSPQHAASVQHAPPQHEEPDRPSNPHRLRTQQRAGSPPSQHHQRAEPYRLRAVGHSLGGMSLLIHAVLAAGNGRRSRIHRLVLLTPAGFHLRLPNVRILPVHAYMMVHQRTLLGCLI
jgi:hypothetical protein